MKNRIRQLMEYTGMSQKDFSNKLGISPASLSSIFTGRTSPTNKHVKAIHTAFPNVNISWLLFGEGDMFTHEEAPSPDSFFAPLGEQHSSEPGSESSGTSLPADMSSTLRQNVGRMGQVRMPEMSVEASFFEKQLRKIKEIRVFYDDGTYEAFVPNG